MLGGREGMAAILHIAAATPSTPRGEGKKRLPGGSGCLTLPLWGLFGDRLGPGAWRSLRPRHVCMWVAVVVAIDRVHVPALLHFLFRPPPFGDQQPDGVQDELRLAERLFDLFFRRRLGLAVARRP